MTVQIYMFFNICAAKHTLRIREINVNLTFSKKDE